MADADTAAEGKPKVFISYSRMDQDFAEELLAGLRFAGFEPYLDKHDIAAGEDWEARLGRLIEAADTVVFVISPDAVASERCAWEIDRTVTLKKRLLPVVWRRVEEPQIPPRLKQLNYIFFDRPLMSVPSLRALSTALRTDLDWIREHTRIGEAAVRWVGRGRNEALLFRGDELAAAKLWLGKPPQFAPEPTLLHLEFIKSGEDAEAARSTAERQRLDQIAAAQGERELALKRERVALDSIKRAQMAIGALFASIIIIGVAWRFQSYLYEQYYWRVKMGPSVLSAAKERDKAATRGWEFTECVHGCPTMIVVPAGKFMMGSPDSENGRNNDESPQREVTIINPFGVGKTEVTFNQYDVCVSAGACQKPPDNNFGRGDRPVINVSWDEAKDYVHWLSRVTGKQYRLLTEAEWEYAARAGTTTRYWWGDEVGEGNGNCSGCKSQWDSRQTAPVGSFKPNAFGLHDMHGNVWEWVEDCYLDGNDNALNDWAARTTDRCPSRIVRGGAYNDYPANLRSAQRYMRAHDYRRFSIGFRVGRVLSPAAS